MLPVSPSSPKGYDAYGMLCIRLSGFLDEASLSYCGCSFLQKEVLKLFRVESHDELVVSVSVSFYVNDV